jgi:hypothetical protein
MCAYSMVLDHMNGTPYQPNKYPEFWPKIVPSLPPPGQFPQSPEDFNRAIDAIKAAKDFDKDRDEPSCESPDKKLILVELIDHVRLRAKREIDDGDALQTGKMLDVLERLLKLLNE